MRRFRFRLETVLHHREMLEGMREQEFGAAQSRLMAEQAALERLRAEFDRCVAERPGGTRGEHFDAHAIYDRERYLETLQAALERQSHCVEAAALTAEEKRAALVAARQAREAVSRLREQDLAAHAAGALKQEQEMLDEQATLRFVRAAEAATSQRRLSSSEAAATEAAATEAAATGAAATGAAATQPPGTRTLEPGTENLSIRRAA